MKISRIFFVVILFVCSSGVSQANNYFDCWPGYFDNSYKILGDLATGNYWKNHTSATFIENKFALDQLELHSESDNLWYVAPYSGKYDLKSNINTNGVILTEPSSLESVEWGNANQMWSAMPIWNESAIPKAQFDTSRYAQFGATFGHTYWEVTRKKYEGELAAKHNVILPDKSATGLVAMSVDDGIREMAVNSLSNSFLDTESALILNGKSASKLLYWGEREEAKGWYLSPITSSAQFESTVSFNQGAPITEGMLNDWKFDSFPEMYVIPAQDVDPALSPQSDYYKKIVDSLAKPLEYRNWWDAGVNGLDSECKPPVPVEELQLSGPDKNESMKEVRVGGGAEGSVGKSMIGSTSSRFSGIYTSGNDAMFCSLLKEGDSHWCRTMGYNNTVSATVPNEENALTKVGSKGQSNSFSTCDANNVNSERLALFIQTMSKVAELSSGDLGALGILEDGQVRDKDGNFPTELEHNFSTLRVVFPLKWIQKSNNAFWIKLDIVLSDFRTWDCSLMRDMSIGVKNPLLRDNAGNENVVPSSMKNFKPPSFWNFKSDQYEKNFENTLVKLLH